MSTIQGIMDFDTKQPDRVALADGTYWTTESDLCRDISDFRNYFAYVGVLPGETVGVLCQTGWAFLLSALGLMTLGAVALPLEADALGDTLESVAQTLSMKHLVAETPQPVGLSVRQLFVSEIYGAGTRRTFPPVAAKPCTGEAPLVASLFQEEGKAVLKQELCGEQCQALMNTLEDTGVFKPGAVHVMETETVLGVYGLLAALRILRTGGTLMLAQAFPKSAQLKGVCALWGSESWVSKGIGKEPQNPGAGLPVQVVVSKGGYVTQWVTPRV